MCPDVSEAVLSAERRSLVIKYINHKYILNIFDIKCFFFLFLNNNRLCVGVTTANVKPATTPGQNDGFKP